MGTKDDSVRIDFASLSNVALFEVIKALEGSPYSSQLEEARKELVKRLRDKGFSSEKIASILVSNEYGKPKRLAIAREWAAPIGITYEEFLELIGER